MGNDNQEVPLTKQKEEEARQRIIRFIKTHYAKTLGKDIELLDKPGGLEALQQKYADKDKDS